MAAVNVNLRADLSEWHDKGDYDNGGYDEGGFDKGGHAHDGEH